jgi:hypothetical protein
MSGECIESGQFSKMAILASTRIRQNWRIFGEYSNSTNSPASGHCLRFTNKQKLYDTNNNSPNTEKQDKCIGNNYKDKQTNVLTKNQQQQNQETKQKCRQQLW